MAFDAIEFGRALRWIDMLDDIALVRRAPGACERVAVAGGVIERRTLRCINTRCSRMRDLIGHVEVVMTNISQRPWPQAGDALLIIDVQVDFLPGGSLAVAGGNKVIAPLNRCIESFVERGLRVLATRDWHPPDHCSFVAQGGPWPPHCVAATPGAAFAPGLRLPYRTQIVSKGTAADRDAYSAFVTPRLGWMLHAAGATHVVVGGAGHRLLRA